MNVYNFIRKAMKKFVPGKSKMVYLSCLQILSVITAIPTTIVYVCLY